MTREDLLKRMQELTRMITESAENHTKLGMMLQNAATHHNNLIGRLEEAKEVYKAMYGDIETPVVVPEVLG